MPATLAIAEFLKRHSLSFVTGWTNANVASYCGFHSHAHYEMVLHVQGGGRTSVAGEREIDYLEGSVVLYPSQAQHDEHCQVPGIDVCLHFGPAAIAFKELRSTLYVAHALSPYVTQEFAALAQPFPAMSALEKSQFDHRISALVAHLCSLQANQTGGQASTPAHRYALQSLDYLKKNLGEIRDIQSVASHCAISADYLRHAFKQYYKIGIKEYLNKLRMEKACGLLLHSHLPIKSIADICGYSSDRHFCTAFKQHHHCTPTGFRQRRASSAAINRK